MACINYSEKEILSLIKNYYKNTNATDYIRFIDKINNNYSQVFLDIEKYNQPSIANVVVNTNQEDGLLLKGVLIIPYNIWGKQ